MGCAILAGLASAAFRDLEEAVGRCVEFGPEIKPNLAWMESINSGQPPTVLDGPTRTRITAAESIISLTTASRTLVS